jgi:predicted HTH transcriptional regulator
MTEIVEKLYRGEFLSDSELKALIETDDKDALLALIAEWESFDLEFKSTIRLNLKTGEKDKRMEKAVLKTLVAFLNSDGGTLLVGVQDDGEILGVDIEGFDNCDKMNLHIINLISSQIGDEFLPFIRFREIDFGKKENGADRMVVRFDCRPTSTPAFFKEGKQEIYFVRSGPSSVELTGSDLIKYVDNRRKSVKRKYQAARGLSVSQSTPEDTSEE